MTTLLIYTSIYNKRANCQLFVIYFFIQDLSILALSAVDSDVNFLSNFISFKWPLHANNNWLTNSVWKQVIDTWRTVVDMHSVHYWGKFNPEVVTWGPVGSPPPHAKFSHEELFVLDAGVPWHFQWLPLWSSPLWYSKGQLLLWLLFAVDCFKQIWSISRVLVLVFSQDSEYMDIFEKWKFQLRHRITTRNQWKCGVSGGDP